MSSCWPWKNYKCTKSRSQELPGGIWSRVYEVAETSPGAGGSQCPKQGSVAHTHRPLHALALCMMSVCLLREYTQEHVRCGDTSPPPCWRTGGSHRISWSISTPHWWAEMSFKEQLDEAKVYMHSLQYRSKHRSWLSGLYSGFKLVLKNNIKAHHRGDCAL